MSRDANKEKAEGDVLDAIGTSGVEWPVLLGTLDSVGRRDGAEKITKCQGRNGCSQQREALLVGSIEHVDIVNSMRDQCKDKQAGIKALLTYGRNRGQQITSCWPWAVLRGCDARLPQERWA